MDDVFEDDVVSKPARAPPTKKSLFNRPAWSKPAEKKKDEVEFFSRAKELFPQRIAEEERKLQKKQLKLERKRTPESVERKALKTPEVKRRRISVEDEHHSPDSSPNQDIGTNDEESTWPRSPVHSSSTRNGQPSSSHSKLQASPTSLSRRYSRDLNKRKEVESKKTKAAAACITLSDSEGDEEFQNLVAKKSTTGPVTLNDNDDDVFEVEKKPISVSDDDDLLMSDEVYPELVQKARERQQALVKQKALERHKAEASFSEKNHRTSDIDDIFGDNNVEVDPVVLVLISSCLENTKPLIVKRRVSQPLKEVRKAWIDAQEPGVLTDAEKADIYLTWKSKPLFDITTCAHLGIKVGSDGKMPSDGLDNGGRLHLEAWTPESFTLFQRQLEKEQNMENAEPEPEPEEVAQKIKLILKAKDMEPIRMKVSATYLVGKMVDLFKQKYPEETDGKDVLLYFDGEMLDPMSMLRDTDLGEPGEVDTVEVLIR